MHARRASHGTMRPLNCGVRRQPLSIAERFASVYRRGAHYFVHANARTVDGFWLASEPAVLLATDSTSQALGDAVFTALTSGALGLATPSTGDYRAVHAPLLAIAKVRSWSALQRTASLCEVWHRGVAIVVEPTRNGGTRGESRGYHHLPEQPRLSSSAGARGNGRCAL
jgi:hypothetical protein